ncbi:TPA: IS200/IS605 family element transposase accessory protein TnpB [Escherichia coli]|nr:IS200/IS605 family element transposase accessory protein TnpB [Escherichia coli]HAW1014838.1 IS200/IS605 family element transposase accessory protein TnpB [Escherichia coli]HAW1539566.1 IS200/IS605 family element transposase accessory protein TnpB [Escherichia coli]
MAIQTKTLQVRVKDRHAALLRQMAFEVNQVFNFINEMTAAEYSTVSEYGPKQRVWLTEFDVDKRIAGIQKERGYHIQAATCQEISKHHAKARKQFKRSKLRWRKSGGAGRSLGWVPFKGAQVKWVNGCIKFAGHYFKVWDSYGLNGFKFRAGNFAEDARGRWYFNVAVEYECEPTKGTADVGIDLGLKDIATTSDGEKLPAKRWYRELEGKLKIAQRAHNKKRVRAIHAKIKNRRKDAHHKFSTALVNKYAAIFVGDVSSKKLSKTNLAKSIYDAGWCQLKNQIQYKAIARSVVFEVVDEAYTTQTCSCCGAISCSSPKGRVGLGIREWICVECGELHDRDVNAAKNILAAGHRRLEGGIHAL